MIDAIDSHTFLSKVLLHPLGQGVKLLFGVISTSDPGLIGDDDNTHAACCCLPADVENTIDELEVLDFVDITEIVIDDTVSVQKQSGFHE